MEVPKRELKRMLRDVAAFAQYVSGKRLRSYQREAALAIVESVIQGQGLSFVVMFPRQSGKNELQANIEAYLLTLLHDYNAEIVKVSPTWKPQSQNAMRRLERVLRSNFFAGQRWAREQGYIYRVGEGARIYFLSGSPTANVVGATASTLLECDEAQDVLIEKWDKDFSPMAASTAATRVFWGTAWISQTLLARELRAARQAERQDGRRRVFVLSADEVAREVPAYGRFVAEQVAKLGRNHPLVRTQFYSEEIDAEGGMFPPARMALMRGGHARLYAPRVGQIYALLVDVAGEALTPGPSPNFGREELVEISRGSAHGSGRKEADGRDATALTVVEVDVSTLTDALVQAPTYRVVDRRLWVGTAHTQLYGELRALIELWQAHRVVIDATGVGAGLASFLDKAFPGRVLPFLFNAATKSRLGWDFLAVVETGRFKDWQPGAQDGDGLQALFFKQVALCTFEVIPGPERRVRWGVADGSRDPVTGELAHDDLVLSAALCALLDRQAWGMARSGIIPGIDPVENLGEVY